VERITKFRAGILLLVFALILSFFSTQLFTSQVVNADENANNATTYTTMTRVKAARGDILDRNGNLLVSNRASYDLVFNNFVILNASGTNAYLQQLVNLCDKMGFEYNEHFPVTMTRPYEYTIADLGLEGQDHFWAYLADMDLDSDITAPLLMSTLRRSYNIPETWSDEDARRVIGIRYELALRSDITSLSNYIFIDDTTEEELASIQELDIPGLMVEPTTVREYHTTYAAHILGYTGAMSAEQWETFRNIDGYLMDAEVGQTGFEEAFEEYLHGVDGWRVDTVDLQGNIIKTYYETEPRAGDNVETTIDLSLQITAEDALKKTMEGLRAQPAGEDGADAEGAAVVVMKVDTGEVLACASYPSYDPAEFFDNYNELLNADYKPLINRALDFTYPPGSTYKMVMAIAGIDYGVIDLDTYIYDEGVFDKYDGFDPQCLLYTQSHGVTAHDYIDVKNALKMSCNYYFFQVADWLHIDQIDSVAKAMGLGEPTGVELYEDEGYRANPDSKAILYDGSDEYWYPADQVVAGIGQSINRFTPMQLAVYTCTLANQGDRYKATFLQRVLSENYTELIVQNVPELVSHLEISDTAHEAYLDGMKLVVDDYFGTAYDVFEDCDYSVAAKTGTAEHSNDGSSDHGAMVCFAPADNPEIAVVVYGEKAGHGSSMGECAQSIIEAYFGADPASDVITYENRVS